MAESEEELKSLLMKGNEESEKVGLTQNIQIVFVFLGSKITDFGVSDFMMAAMKLKELCFLEEKLWPT